MKEKTITQLGSNWNNWSNAGTFYWNLNNSVSNRNRNIRGHLIYRIVSWEYSQLIFYPISFNPATRQNRKIGGADKSEMIIPPYLITKEEMSTVFTGHTSDIC